VENSGRCIGRYFCGTSDEPRHSRSGNGSHLGDLSNPHASPRKETLHKEPQPFYGSYEPFVNPPIRERFGWWHTSPTPLDSCIGNPKKTRGTGTSPPLPTTKPAPERNRPVRMNPIVVVQVDHLLIVRGSARPSPCPCSSVVINSGQTTDLLELRYAFALDRDARSSVRCSKP